MGRIEYQVNERLRARLSEDFPGMEVVADRELKLPKSYLDTISIGRKTTTIKYKKDALRTPIPEMPAVEKETGRFVGTARYKFVTVATFGELTDEDARRDGFDNLSELRRVMHESYGELDLSTLVTIHHIDLFE